MSPPEGTPSWLIASFYYGDDPRVDLERHCERVTISVTSVSLSSIALAPMLLAF